MREGVCLGHPALEQIFAQLGAVGGLPVARVASALASLLTPIRASSWPEVAWCSSALTSSGFPVEFAFASHGQEMRYTCEVAGPETPERARLAIALARLAQLEGCGCQDLLPAWLPAMQQAATLRYGAWISGRHSADGDRYKLYAEVPSDETPAVRAYITQWLGQDYLLAERQSTLRMIGIEPATSRMELYFRLHHLELHHLYPLLAHAGCRQQAALLVDFIQRQRRWPNPHRLPGNWTGVSYAFAPGAARPMCTIFLPAGRLWGEDGAIRGKLVQLSAQYKWQMADYLALSQALPLPAGGKHRHGLVGLSVIGNNQLRLGIGLSLV
jgi:hypothetical protein